MQAIKFRKTAESSHADFVQYFLLQRVFSHKEQREDFQHGLNHNKYMVTDDAVYIGRQCRFCNKFSLVLFYLKFTHSKSV